jgi:prepilin-type N-terminal cleavage/methylation domain-containing protein
MNAVPVSKFRGFTLVEVMMAATILVVGLVGMMQAVTIGSEMLDTGRKQTLAAQIIQDQIERVRLMNWNDVAAIAPDPAPVVLSANLLTQGGDFICQRSASDVKTNLRKVTFTVAWKSSGNRSHSRVGETYVGKDGLSATYQRP